MSFVLNDQEKAQIWNFVTDPTVKKVIDSFLRSYMEISVFANTLEERENARASYVCLESVWEELKSLVRPTKE